MRMRYYNTQTRDDVNELLVKITFNNIDGCDARYTIKKKLFGRGERKYYTQLMATAEDARNIAMDMLIQNLHTLTNQ